MKRTKRLTCSDAANSNTAAGFYTIADFNP